MTFWLRPTPPGLDQIENPVGKVKKLLENYRDRYLKDTKTFPGGCIFVALSVELDDQRPHLSREINEGFVRLKAMIKEFLDQGKISGELRQDVDTEAVTEMVFAGMLGTSVNYGMEKSIDSLEQSINSLIHYIENLAP